MKSRLIALALAVLAAPPAFASPADLVAAVSANGRAAANVKLDDARRPAEVLKFLGIEKGDRVLDLMAGAGYYTEILARAVGAKGYVLAVEPPGFAASDASKKAWSELKAANRNAGQMLIDLPNLALAPASFDAAMLHLVYHDFYWQSEQYNFPRVEPDAVLAKLFRAMKPGGVVGVVDHVGNAGDTRAIVDAVHRIDPAVIKADFARAGFVLDGESDVLRNPGDDLAKLVFDPAVRGKTDRVVYRFVKPVPPCDAAAAQAFVGKKLSQRVRNAAQEAAGAGLLRDYKTGAPVTMDFRADRLNIETDASGIIVKATCG